MGWRTSPPAGSRQKKQHLDWHEVLRGQSLLSVTRQRFAPSTMISIYPPKAPTSTMLSTYQPSPVILLRALSIDLGYVAGMIPQHDPFVLLVP